MIGLDTNILARFYVDDPNDLEAAKQRPMARKTLSESTHLNARLSCCWAAILILSLRVPL